MSMPSDPDLSPDDPNPYLSKSNDVAPPTSQPQPPQLPQSPTYTGSPAYPPYYYGPPQRTNGLAVASLVLGILWIYWLGSILALIFGYVARKQIRERQESGEGMAIAGIVLGWVGVGVLTAIFGLAFIAYVSSA